MNDIYDLNRFVAAQQDDYERALSEIASGQISSASVSRPSREDREVAKIAKKAYLFFFVIIVVFRLRQGFGGPP